MKAHEMIAQVRDLPTISLSALRLVTILGDSEAAIQDAVEIIKQDASLTAKLLRVCNSPCLAFEEPVSSVDQAVFLLGNKRVYNMVTAMSLRGPLDTSLDAYAMEGSDLWRHSLVAATAAEMLVTEGIKIDVNSSTAFTIGLLHDIGKLVTNRFFTPQSLISMKRLVARGQPAIEAEKTVLGTDHAEVGAALAYTWRLPDFIVEAIGFHHTPPHPPRLSALAYFANQIAHELDVRGPHETPVNEIELRIRKTLGFAVDRSQGFIDQVLETSVKTEELVAMS